MTIAVKASNKRISFCPNRRERIVGPINISCKFKIIGLLFTSIAVRLIELPHVLKPGKIV